MLIRVSMLVRVFMGMGRTIMCVLMCVCVRVGVDMFAFYRVLVLMIEVHKIAPFYSFNLDIPTTIGISIYQRK